MSTSDSTSTRPMSAPSSSMAELPFKKIKNSSSPPNAPGSLNALARDKSLDAEGGRVRQNSLTARLVFAPPRFQDSSLASQRAPTDDRSAATLPVRQLCAYASSYFSVYFRRHLSNDGVPFHRPHLDLDYSYSRPTPPLISDRRTTAANHISTTRHTPRRSRDLPGHPSPQASHDVQRHSK
jgi:hypothetical protein